MRILVTGAAGFVGARLSETASLRGVEVVGVDCLTTNYDVSLKEHRLIKLIPLSGFLYHNLDLCKMGRVENTLGSETLQDRYSYSDNKIDAIIHLAALAGVRQSLAEPERYITHNTLSTLNVLKLAVELEVKNVVIASTSAMYPALDRPTREDEALPFPQSPYAASKKMCELMAHQYHLTHGLNVTVLRYFSVYGPAGRPDSRASVFQYVRRIHEGLLIKIYGDPTQKRDFTYVDDVVDATLKAAELKGFNVINIGGGNPVAVNSIIHHIADRVGQVAQSDLVPSHYSDTACTWANIERAEKLLGWKPMTKIEDGLDRCIEWYRENREWAKEIE